MIQTEQLTSALERLDPEHRELLEFSLRRRVPDEALARLYECETLDVARRRAGAIDRLADDLEVQRGEDLGTIIKTLLEPEIWESVDSRGNVRDAPVAVAAPPGANGEHPAVAPPAGPHEPVLEMLGHDGAARPGRRRVGQMAAAGIAGTALLVAAGVVGAAVVDDDGGGPASETQTRPFVPERSGPLANPFPSDPQSAIGYATAEVRGATTLYDSPGGRRKIRISKRTEWGSQRVLGVVRQQGAWVAVQAPELRNGDIAWVPEDRVTLGTVTWSIHVDLSKRLLVVRNGGRTMRRTKVAVGSPRHPTPTGRFSVTDKLRVTNGGSPYGCCVLALSGHQTRLPEDWPGGDRLAVHATTDLKSIGRPVSLGCMRATPGAARWIVRTVPIGTPIYIRS